MNQEDKFKNSIPVGELGIVALESCKELGQKVNDYIVEWREKREGEHLSSLHYNGYVKEDYLIKTPPKLPLYLSVSSNVPIIFNIFVQYQITTY